MACLSLSLWANAADEQPKAETPRAEKPASKWPVQEGDDPIREFDPANKLSNEDMLKGDALAWFMTAQLHYTRGENEKGLAALKNTVEKDPKSLIPYRVLVPALLEARDLPGAREFALKGAAVKPEGIALVQGVAAMFARIGKTDDAIALLNEGLPLVPVATAELQHLSVQRLLGNLLRASGHPKEAADHNKIVFDALTRTKSPLTPEQVKETLGDAGALFDDLGQTFLQAGMPELALQSFDEAAKYRPARPGLHSYNLALLFRQTNKPEQGLAELDKYFSVQLQSKRRAAYQLLKDLLVDLKREDELIGRLQKLHTADQQNPHLAYFLADELQKAGKTDEALKIYTSAPGWARAPEALVGLLPIYRQRKDAAELLSTLTKAFQVVPIPNDAAAPLDPETGELSERFVKETDSLTKDEAAMTALVEHATKLQKEEPPKLEFFPAYILGKLCTEANRTDDAIGLYKFAISTQNAPPWLLYREIAFHCIQEDRCAVAIELLEEAMQHPNLERERPSIQSYLGLALEMEGKTEQALAALSAARKQFPRSLELLDREAWVFYHSQQWQKAIAAYESLIETGTEQGADTRFINGWRFSLSAIYVHIENFEKGEKILEDVLAIEPDNTQANNDLGYLWADRGKNLDKAKGMIEKALAKEPDNAAYLDSMGWLEFRLGNYPAARDNLLKAVANPKRQDATIWDHLGDVYEKMGSKDEAIKAWVKALEIEIEKPKPDDKLVTAVKAKVPTDRVPMKKPPEANKGT